MRDLFDLTDKTAIVTGGNGGIGLGIARGLASKGANLVIAARNKEKTKTAAEDIINDFNVRVLQLHLDVQDEIQVNRMVEQSLEKFGRIDILVNNAGIAINRKPEDYSAEEWDRIINTNLKSVFLCSKAVYPSMKKAGGGKIICIGSMYSIFGGLMSSIYGASKGGVMQYMRGLAVSWARDNIQVNAILPGWIETDMVMGVVKAFPGFKQSLEARTPMGRLGRPDDISGAAIFLASESSDFITGAGIPVDGGWAILG